MKATLQHLREALEPGAGLVLVGGAVRDRLMGRPEGDWDRPGVLERAPAELAA